MNKMWIFVLVLMSSGAHAGTIYRCENAAGAVELRDYPCAQSTQQAQVVTPAASPARDHNREYLDYLERERAAAKAAQDAHGYRQDETVNQYQNSAATEQQADAVRRCKFDQSVDEARSSRARYSCDPVTGQKILPDRVFIQQNGNQRYR